MKTIVRLVVFLLAAGMVLFITPAPGSDLQVPSQVPPEVAAFAYRSNGPVDQASLSGKERTSHFWDDNSGWRPALAPQTRANLCFIAANAAVSYNLPISFFTRLIEVESGFRSEAVSPMGALGIAQFMPDVASSRGLSNPFDPTAALAESARYLAELVAAFGSLDLAAAAYNAGPQRVRDWIAQRRQLPSETRQYLLRITGTPVDTWSPADPVKAGPSFPASVCDATKGSVWQADASATPGMLVSMSPFVARPRRTIRSEAERHSLPRPSQFAVGKAVPPAILASEKAALARLARDTGARGGKDGHDRGRIGMQRT